MTIAAGFICDEGLLLASDTLYAGINKRYGRKIWPITRGDLVVGFGGGGTQAGLERTRYEIEQRLASGLSQGAVIEVIEDALMLVMERQPPEEHTQGLFAIRVGGVCSLFENSGGAMLSPIGHASQCVGWPTGLGQYFLDRLYRQPMSMKWARIVAAHLIKQAKDYSEHCDGDTHFLEIQASGEPRFVDDQSEIAKHEGYLAAIDEAMQLVLPGGDASDATIGYRLKILNEVIERARKSVVIEASAAFTLRPVTLEAKGEVVTPLKPTENPD